MTRASEESIARAKEQVNRALYAAIHCHKPLNSLHEAYAILLEEVDELWQEIKKQVPDSKKVAIEASHVAAVAMRILAELV